VPPRAQRRWPPATTPPIGWPRAAIVAPRVDSPAYDARQRPHGGHVRQRHIPRLHLRRREFAGPDGPSTTCPSRGSCQRRRLRRERLPALGQAASSRVVPAGCFAGTRSRSTVTGCHHPRCVVGVAEGSGDGTLVTNRRGRPAPRARAGHGPPAAGEVRPAHQARQAALPICCCWYASGCRAGEVARLTWTTSTGGQEPSSCTAAAATTTGSPCLPTSATRSPATSSTPASRRGLGSHTYRIGAGARQVVQPEHPAGCEAGRGCQQERVGRSGTPRQQQGGGLACSTERGFGCAKCPGSPVRPPLCRPAGPLPASAPGCGQRRPALPGTRRKRRARIWLPGPVDRGKRWRQRPQPQRAAQRVWSYPPAGTSPSCPWPTAPADDTAPSLPPMSSFVGITDRVFGPYSRPRCPPGARGRRRAWASRLRCEPLTRSPALAREEHGRGPGGTSPPRWAEERLTAEHRLLKHNG
jgi:hypothetical protein